MAELEQEHIYYHHHFTIGSEVEVSIDEEGYKGALFRATVLRLPVMFSPSKKKKAWVEYKTLVTSKYGSRKLKEHVDILCLKPVPPDIADSDIEEGDIVDAVDKDAWWTGVVQKVLENGRYSVFFASPPHVIVFERSKVRLHQDWVDGKWVRPQKMEKKEPIDGSCELDEQGTRLVDGYRGNILGQSLRTGVTDKQGKDDSDVLEKTPEEVGTKKEQKDDLASENKCMAISPQKKNIQLLIEVDQRLKLAESVEKDSNDQTKVNGMELEQRQSSWNSQKRKRGRPRKLPMLPSKATGDENQDGNGGNTDKVALRGCINDFQVLHRSVNDFSQFETKGVENITVSSNMDEDDRPLLMLFGEKQYFPNLNGSKRTLGKTAKRRIKGSEEESAVTEMGSVENLGWPFAKNSPIWKAIDSLEVFRVMPQTPHFRPVGTYKEESREGLAIGHMVTFASLAEKISKLQFDDPRHIFESALESLFDLEQHGFDVSVLCNRVNELLSLKVRQLQNLEEIKGAETKIIEYNQEEKNAAEEIEAIKKNIDKLQKRYAAVKAVKETKARDIEKLQLTIEAIRECYQRARLDFEKQAALPFKQV